MPPKRPFGPAAVAAADKQRKEKAAARARGSRDRKKSIAETLKGLPIDTVEGESVIQPTDLNVGIRALGLQLAPDLVRATVTFENAQDAPDEAEDYDREDAPEQYAPAPANKPTTKQGLTKLDGFVLRGNGRSRDKRTTFEKEVSQEIADVNNFAKEAGLEIPPITDQGDVDSVVQTTEDVSASADSGSSSEPLEQSDPGDRRATSQASSAPSVRNVSGHTPVRQGTLGFKVTKAKEPERPQAPQAPRPPQPPPQPGQYQPLAQLIGGPNILEGLERTGSTSSNAADSIVAEESRRRVSPAPDEDAWVMIDPVQPNGVDGDRTTSSAANAANAANAGTAGTATATAGTGAARIQTVFPQFALKQIQEWLTKETEEELIERLSDESLQPNDGQPESSSAAAQRAAAVTPGPAPAAAPGPAAIPRAAAPPPPAEEGDEEERLPDAQPRDDIHLRGGASPLSSEAPEPSLFLDDAPTEIMTTEQNSPFIDDEEDSIDERLARRRAERQKAFAANSGRNPALPAEANRAATSRNPVISLSRGRNVASTQLPPDSFQAPRSGSFEDDYNADGYSMDDQPEEYDPPEEDELDTEPEDEEEEDEDQRHRATTQREINEAKQDTLDKMLKLFKDGFPGCTEEEHTAWSVRHDRDVGVRAHRGLARLLRGESLPDTLGHPTIKPAEELFGTSTTPTPNDWKEVFCGGRSGRHREAHHVCLHKEETMSFAPEIGVDIDSYMGFATSLAFAQNGLEWQAVPLTKQNITTDVHIDLAVDEQQERQGEPVRRAAMLKRIPHFFLGRLTGDNTVGVYIFLPRLYQEGHMRNFVALPEHIIALWTNKVWLPALSKCYRSDYLQHLRSSWKDAKAATEAAKVENRSVGGQSYGQQTMNTIHLSPDRLELLWETVLQNIEQDPELKEKFHGLNIFFDSKGTKLHFKNTDNKPQLLDAMDKFEAHLEGIMDMQFVNEDAMWIDIGREICPPHSWIGFMALPVGEQPQVYLWRDCCLKRFKRFMYSTEKPARASTYHHCMLRDATSMTYLSKPDSRVRTGGLIYSQFYGSVKQLMDPGSHVTPMAHERIELLAVDAEIVKSVASISRGRCSDMNIVQRAYEAGKRRAHTALKDGVQKSFGIREEHRVTRDLFRRMHAAASSPEQPELRLRLNGTPSYVWAITTQVYTGFIWRNLDRFTTAFEWARAETGIVVPWQRTKLMCAFLRCMRYALETSDMSREGALWWDRKVHTGVNQKRLKYGLGFSQTLTKYGFCWWLPVVDWSRMQFKVRYSDHMYFGSNALGNKHRRRAKLMESAQDFLSRVDFLADFLKRAQMGDSRGRIVDTLAFQVVQQLAADVLAQCQEDEYLSPDICKNARETIPDFTWLNLKRFFKKIHIVGGNRGRKRPMQLVSLLIGVDDGLKRDNWDKKPYRVLHRRSLNVLHSLQDRDNYEERYNAKIITMLQDHFPILPYATQQSLIGMENKHRQWLSTDVLHRDEDGKEDPMFTAESRWIQLQSVKGNYSRAYSKHIPGEWEHYFKWSKVAWMRWLASEGDIILSEEEEQMLDDDATAGGADELAQDEDEELLRALAD